MQIRLKWYHVPAEHDGEEFWTAPIGRTGISVQVASRSLRGPAIGGWSIVITTHHDDPLRTFEFKAGEIATLASAQRRAIALASDYFRTVSKALDVGALQ